jgi:pheromone a factor receptor
MQSHDTAMSARQNRIRRKLYFMTLGILVIVVPLTLAFFILNIVDGWVYWSQPYDFNAIHYGPDPFNTYFISFTTSDLVRSVDMNMNYIPALTGFVTFFVFGTTADSLNSYRKMLLCFGLGYIFPRLREEYRPTDGRRSAGRSWLSSISRVFPGRSGRRSSDSDSSKHSILPTIEHVSQSTRCGNQSSRRGEISTSKSDTVCSSARQGLSSPPIDAPNLWPDLSPHTTTTDAPPAPPQPAQHNPWVLRTVLSFFPLKFLPSRLRACRR